MKQLSLILISLLCSSLCFGQSQKLDFTTDFYDAVDKWAALRTTVDSAYFVGFIYIDGMAGFSFRQVAIVKETAKGLEIIPGDQQFGTTRRLGPGTPRVAVMSDETIEKLSSTLPELSLERMLIRLQKEEQQRTNYDKSSPSYLVKIGYWYNAIGASHRAIEHLLIAYEKEPHFERLEFELAHAYNATQQFDKAIPVLQRAIRNNPQNALFYKELVFSFVNKDRLDDAEYVYLQGTKWTTDRKLKAEMAVNIAGGYQRIRNKAKFDEWAKLVEEYAGADSEWYQMIKNVADNWDKR